GIHASAEGTNAYAGWFIGTVYSTGTISAESLVQRSDIRFKKDVQTLDGALDKVLKLRGVSYYWKNKEEIKALPNTTTLNPDGAEELNYDFEANKKQVGVIAQEVEEIMPELVSTDMNGYKSVDYTKLTPVLIEAIKEQQKQIDELKRLVEELMNK
ncbi:MAG: tail fiber domain-containing protein, partial [Salinivirgaceae bacterium]|nr:tail fiber domain-containing protein [Salinivirgaceae bacterium]